MKQLYGEELIKFLDGVDPFNKNITAQIANWGPPQFRYVLKYHNGDNRDFSKGNEKSIEESYDKDNYIFNGESCSFNTEGNLTEWQHRMKVFEKRMEDSKTVPVNVSTGVAPSSFTKGSTPLVRKPLHEVQRYLNNTGNPYNLKGKTLSQIVQTMGQFLSATGRETLTLQNAVDKYEKWGNLAKEANETVKDFFEETKDEEKNFDGFRVRFSAFAMAMIHINEKEVLINFLNLLKNQLLELSSVKVISDFFKVFESGEVSFMKSTAKGKLIFFLCTTACDRLKKKEDGVIALGSNLSKCNHEHLVKKSSGSFYRKFHVNPDNININSVTYKTTSVKQAIEGVEARV